MSSSIAAASINVMRECDLQHGQPSVCFQLAAKAAAMTNIGRKAAIQDCSAKVSRRSELLKTGAFTSLAVIAAIPSSISRLPARDRIAGGAFDDRSQEAAWPTRTAFLSASTPAATLGAESR
jgi:hypothetical protein